MSFHETLPHWFLVIVIVIVVVFLVKSLIKFAIIIGLVGLAVYLIWSLGLIDKMRGNLVLPQLGF